VASKKIISGIQQIGIGVENISEAWAWYRKYFGMDICIFEEKAVAEFMLHYTQGKPRERHAVLAMNMQGGGGFEVWQHTGKKPQPPKTPLELGDLGINVCKMKTQDATELRKIFTEQKLNIVSDIVLTPDGFKSFFIADPYSNLFQFIEHPEVFMKTQHKNGGVIGAVIGVTDIKKSMVVYQDILNYDTIVYDKTGQFDDILTLNGGKAEVRRVLLKHGNERKGPFSKLLGPTQIELIQAIERTPKSVFHGRMWGDPGFIHICFDISGFFHLRDECKRKGFPFTVDSTIALAKAFDMGDAAGNFSYISDPDGTPIEFVETRKVPLIKKFGLYIKLYKRDPEKSLPVWVLKALRFQRKK
jgi:catechol 2,3-dioxygenase-like lactoylglutathione lyase family enzyme